MHLIVSGVVRAGRDYGQGKLLLTSRSVFLFRSVLGVAQEAILGGLLGFLLSRWLTRSGRNQSAILEDNEIAELGDPVRRQLRGLKLLAKVPLDSCAIKRTLLGFSFDTPQLEIRYNGLVHKKKVAGFLLGLGRPVA